MTTDEIRVLRETECFAVVDRGPLWYARLSTEQTAELAEWHTAWLDAPETGVIPERLDWLE